MLLSGALLLALVVLRGDGTPLLAVLPRERALAAYVALLLFFPLFTLPWVLQHTPRGGGRRAATVLAVDSLLFASVPMVFCAYISAVSWRGLLCAAMLALAAAALPLALARFGRTAGNSKRISACVAAWMAVAPFAVLLARGFGTAELSTTIATISPLDWVQRICLERMTPTLWPFAGVALALWVLALLPRRAITGAALASVCCVLLPWQAESVRVESLAAGCARAGARTPVLVSVPRASSACLISTGRGAVQIPADGLEHLVLLMPGEAQGALTVRLENAVQRVTAPWRNVPLEEMLVGRLGAGAGDGEVRLDPRCLELGPGAYEAFDVIVLRESAWDALSVQQRDVLSGAAAMGALVLLDHARAALEARTGTGSVKRIAASASGDASWRAWRRPPLGSADREFLDTFVPLQWQELDLTSVFWFVLIYHLAFLLAFLLPMTLDAHKAPTVYLISVSFVVLMIAAGGYGVLKHIFLKDNQVYTQSMGFMLSPQAPGQPLVLRRFLAYASMSAEERVVEFPREADLSVLRASHALQEPQQLVAETHSRWRLFLDRHQDKVLVRVDSREQAPWAFEELGDGGIRMTASQSSGALSKATVRAALLIEGGRVLAQYRPEQGVLRRSEEDHFFAAGLEALFRKLQGRYGVPVQRHLLLALEGVERGDVATDWLVQRDLGCFWMVPLPQD